MKINFTKDEYRLLLDMIYLADWMIHSHNEGDELNLEYKALRKKLLSHYKEMNSEDRIEYVDEDDEYYEFSNYDDEIHSKFIHDYDEKTFWDELTSRLSQRDAKDFKKQCALEYSYSEEFEKNGLSNLKVVSKK